jgi:hypothetical protein
MSYAWSVRAGEARVTMKKISCGSTPLLLCDAMLATRLTALNIMKQLLADAAYTALWGHFKPCQRAKQQSAYAAANRQHTCSLTCTMTT